MAPVSREHVAPNDKLEPIIQTLGKKSNFMLLVIFKRFKVSLYVFFFPTSNHFEYVHMVGRSSLDQKIILHLPSVEKVMSHFTYLLIHFFIDLYFSWCNTNWKSKLTLNASQKIHFVFTPRNSRSVK